MQIVLKLKPAKMKAKTKTEILRQLEGGMWARRYFSNVYSSKGNFLVRREDGREMTVRLYNLEKINRKVEVTKRTITRGKRKGEVEVTRRVIRESGWTANYYDLPYEMVEKAQQKARHFTLKLKV